MLYGFPALFFISHLIDARTVFESAMAKYKYWLAIGYSLETVPAGVAAATQ